MQDFADRTWCTKPESQAWIDAAYSERSYISKKLLGVLYRLSPSYIGSPRHVVIGSGREDFALPERFERALKQPAHRHDFVPVAVNRLFTTEGV